MGNWFDGLKNREGKPSAAWIWPAEGCVRRMEVGLFRGRLAVPADARTVELHVSAEGRYAVWLGDSAEALGRGPARGDFRHRSMDTYRIDLERVSQVVVWAQVLWAAGGSVEIPLAETYGPMPGFICFARFLDARGEVIGVSGTGAEGDWQAALCTGLAREPLRGVQGYVCIGQQDVQRSGGWPADWRSRAGGSANWAAPRVVGAPYFKQDPDVPWSWSSGHGWLVPREIPFMREEAMVLWKVEREGVAAANNGKGGGSESLTGVELKAGERAVFHVDAGELVLGYLRATVKVAGTRVAITTSEIVRDANGGKAFSLDAMAGGGKIAGVTDAFIHDAAGEWHTFEVSHWRAFRFLQVEVTAGPDGGELVSLHASKTGYPFDAEFTFETDGTHAELTQKIVDVSWRTLERCAWETYMDCPYYEQLQYIGDTRIACLVTYMTTGDLSLPAQALRAFDRSRLPEGLTQSRSPHAASAVQIIPPFSLVYILMIEDYLMHSGDEGLVAELRPGIAPILNWFSQYVHPDNGLIGRMPYWAFVDWVQGWDKGVPPHDVAGVASEPASACINLFYLMGLQGAARIYERTKAGSGNFYATRATALKRRLHDAFFDQGRGLMCDVPLDAGRGRQGVWSQHAQALSVLADVLSPTEARTALAQALDERNVLLPTREGAVNAGNAFISPASLYFRFYLAEAAARMRMGEQLWPLLEPFRAALARGSTTWPESLEPSRSECHGWSSWPLYFFGRHVLGIAPPSPEDQRIRIRPLHCPPFDTARGTFQTYRGPIRVEVAWQNGRREVKAAGPGVEVLADGGT